MWLGAVSDYLVCILIDKRGQCHIVNEAQNIGMDKENLVVQLDE